MSASRVTRSSTRAQRNATAARQADVAAEPKPEAPTCGVCFDAIKCQGRLDVCKHAFCYDCIKEWSAESNTCPLCQARFHKLTKHDLGSASTNTTTAQSESVRDADNRGKGSITAERLSMALMLQAMGIPLPLLPFGSMAPLVFGLAGGMFLGPPQPRVVVPMNLRGSGTASDPIRLDSDGDDDAAASASAAAASASGGAATASASGSSASASAGAGAGAGRDNMQYCAACGEYHRAQQPVHDRVFDFTRFMFPFLDEVPFTAVRPRATSRAASSARAPPRRTTNPRPGKRRRRS